MSQVLLSGEFDHTLDPKGRVTLPARYREHFSRSAVLVLLPDREPCISVYHPDEWKRFDEKHVEPLDVFGNEDHSWTVRNIYDKLDEVEPDRQGRVLVPAQRIKDLDLSGKVKILGNRDHLEIWNPDTLEAYRMKRRGGHA
jgi:MraZ protein